MSATRLQIASNLGSASVNLSSSGDRPSWLLRLLRPVVQLRSDAGPLVTYAPAGEPMFSGPVWILLLFAVLAIGAGLGAAIARRA